MASALLAATLPGLRADAQGGPEPPLVRQARATQRSFEFTRRVRLPPDDPRPDPERRTYYWYGNGCPVRIGRVCWWDNNDDDAAPPEPASVIAARDRLLGDLERAATEDPANLWVVGQRVRYLLETRRPTDAVTVANACAPVSAWCLGLRGAALHLTNRDVEAAAAFDSADALRTPAERCAWYDLSPWLDVAVARPYRRLACGSDARAHWESRFWILAQPLWSRPVNDLRNAWNTRRTMARVHADGANPYGMNWGDDLAEAELRYGWPTGWSTRESAGGASSPYSLSGDAGRSVTGHEPAPSYDWVPRSGTLAPERRGVADVPDGAWTLRPSPAALPTPMRYAPAYAGGGVGALTHQVARFRRGDTAVVVGTYDTARDSIWSEGSTPPSLQAALIVRDDSGQVAASARRDSAGRSGVLVARVPGAGSARTDRSEARWLLGVEVLQRDTVHTSDGRRVLGRALRVRDGWRPLASGAAISDLLLLRRSPGPTPSLEAALDSAAGSRTVRRGAQGAIYWEQYDVASSTTSAPAGVGSAGANVAPDTIVIAATRLTQSLRGRLAGALRLGSAERPIALRFPDPAAGGAVVGHAIALTWPDVPPGEYQLDVTRVPGSAGRQSATSSLVVQITDN